MKNKFIETLRNFLQKTWLPLKKKRDAFVGRLRLSMSLRISLNYLKLMVVNGVIFMGVFLILYLNVQTEEYRVLADAVTAVIMDVAAVKSCAEIGEGLLSDTDKSGGEPLDNLSGKRIEEQQSPATWRANIRFREWILAQNSLNPYTERGVSLMIQEKTTGEVLYNDTEVEVKGFLFFKDLHLDLSDKIHHIIINSRHQFPVGGMTYELIYSYNMTKDYNRMWQLMLNMVFLYAVIVFFILHEARGQNLRMLTPIQEMSDTINRITVNNLHSERLNPSGITDELRELAETFNDTLDRLETSYESQKQFVSDASHELRTPIAVVQGYANLLKRWGSKDEDVLAESVEAISNEALQMQDLVEKLLFLSRHDKKTLKLKKEQFNMKPIVEEMVKETRLVAKNREIEAPILEAVRVYGDKQALKQAIRVFIDNAQKYTEDGDIIRISCENQQGDCVITVEDTGIGMKGKDLDNIFSRFYRADDVRDKKIEGHGLGLSIAKLIIMAHTGRIKIRTQYTKGTSFIVTIPKRR